MIKRIFDIMLSIIAIITLTPFIIITGCMVFISDPGPLLYWSKRVGKNNTLFFMPKFRSMKISTPEVATHLLTNSSSHLIKWGGLLRKSSLDELPQLWSILKGDMSFVGPRPALFNQYDLIKLRTDVKVHNIKPGLTGWAQINGRDDIPICEKVKFDLFYLENKSILFDIKIILLTFSKVAFSKDISH